MSFRLHVRVAALHEYSAAAIWYEKQNKGLGHRFLDDVQRCFAYIRDNPNGFQLRKDEFRHAMLDDFPYRVIFKIKGLDVYVYQVRHTSRRPNRQFGP